MLLSADETADPKINDIPIIDSSARLPPPSSVPRAKSL
jgi:hypothetical protein